MKRGKERKKEEKRGRRKEKERKAGKERNRMILFNTLLGDRTHFLESQNVDFSMQA